MYEKYPSCWLQVKAQFLFWCSTVFGMQPFVASHSQLKPPLTADTFPLIPHVLPISPLLVPEKAHRHLGCATPSALEPLWPPAAMKMAIKIHQNA